jgi:GTPase SAR1 family protein
VGIQDMDNLEDMDILKKLIDKINNDPDGLERFLLSNSYTKYPIYNFDGLVTHKIFLNYLYYESENVSELRGNIFNHLYIDNGKNTAFILGYQGCGKTTFINVLTNFYFEEAKIDRKNVLVVDCDNFGVSSEEEPINIIYAKSVLKYIKENNKSLQNLVSFFTKNAGILITNCSAYQELYNFYTYSISFLKNKHITNIHNITELNIELNKYKTKILIYLLAFLSFSIEYDGDINNDPIFLVVDNLDCIDNLSELHKFIKGLDDFTVEMSKIFHDLQFYEKTYDKKFNFVDKIKIIIGMRETTRAQLPNTHFSDTFKKLYKPYDITVLYKKNRIVKKRSNSLLRIHEKLESNSKGSGLKIEKKRSLELINKAMNDNYTNSVFSSLFNNNYRKFIPIIIKIVEAHIETIEEYVKIIKDYSYGARGIIWKYLLDELHSTDATISDVSCFKKIGVIDFNNRKNDEVSIPRMILSYLSQRTSTRCDDVNNCITVRSIIDVFDGIFSKEELLSSLKNMYDLKDSKWSHLISFSQLENDRSKDLNNFDYLDLDNSKLHYSCAGKIFLEYVTSHFEFFSTRLIDGNKNEPLFSKNNLSMTNSSYTFIKIINDVFSEVKRCCESLKKHNKKVCEKKGIIDPYDKVNGVNNVNLYLNSDYVTLFKRKEQPYGLPESFKEFHEERILSFHISYIDSFRLYILNKNNTISNDEKIEINRLLSGAIKEYVDLFHHILIRDNTRLNLLPYYIEQLKKVKDKPDDFSIKIDRWNSVKRY